MRPEDLAARVWPGRDLTISSLDGGITNRNYRIVVDGGEAFVLRIAGRDTEVLGIDRRNERAAAEMAAAVGVGPEVVAFVEPEGCLVTRFLDGTGVPMERMRAPQTIRRVAAALRAIHAGPPIPGRFDPHRVVEAYARAAAERGITVPSDYGWGKGVADRIEAARGRRPLVPCHNDLLNANLIEVGDRIRIVDWEYAGMGDAFFDLGNLSTKHRFDLEHDLTLLEAYLDGHPDPAGIDEGLAHLRLMRFMADFFEAMWGVVQQAVSALDVDFVAYAAENFDRLKEDAADPRFEDWLERAASSSRVRP